MGQKMGCNLLRYFRRPNSGVTDSPTFRRFVTLERHFHLFGSIQVHKRVLESVDKEVGGNWDQGILQPSAATHPDSDAVLLNLEMLEAMCCGVFGVAKNSLGNEFDDTIIRKTQSNLSMLTQVFPKCGKVSEKPVMAR